MMPRGAVGRRRESSKERMQMNPLNETLAADPGTEIATGAVAQSTVVPIDDEPAPRLIVEPPLPGPLAQGVAFIPYRVENLRILPWAGRPHATCLRASAICTLGSTTCPGSGRIMVRATPSSWSACREASTRC